MHPSQTPAHVEATRCNWIMMTSGLEVVDAFRKKNKNAWFVISTWEGEGMGDVDHSTRGFFWDYDYDIWEGGIPDDSTSRIAVAWQPIPISHTRYASRAVITVVLSDLIFTASLKTCRFEIRGFTMLKI